jgi:hypothetical protein
MTFKGLAGLETSEAGAPAAAEGYPLTVRASQCRPHRLGSETG